MCDLENWVRLLVLQAEKQASHEIEQVDLKFSIDARVQFDKGHKATEGVIEILNVPGLGMDSCASIVKWEGNDGAKEIRAHVQGVKLETPTEDADSFIPSIGVQLKTLVDNGITIDYDDERPPRTLSVTLFECHDMVSACAIVDPTISVLSNDFNFFSDEVTKAKKNIPQGKRRIGNCLALYIVKEGDTMSSVAFHHFMTLELLKVSLNILK